MKLTHANEETMIEAGETGGILDVILQRLATYVEKAVRLKAAVKSALIYPVAVVGMAVIIVGALLKWVVPIFANLFAGLGVSLPLPTRITMSNCRWSVRKHVRRRPQPMDPGCRKSPANLHFPMVSAWKTMSPASSGLSSRTL